jgi:hypothetical protein
MRYRCRICGIDFGDMMYTMHGTARERAVMHAKRMHPKAPVWSVISEIWA